ncbi:hypothetical protein IE53DRAFT_387281 [Violaceomyces palustris]|uniref:Uncharacterized protein n=1 Tax=Violaceomyces palustris TaxID=1673888 RepID=A0ACD0NXB8_9BASI|nr:hypothetical protein IE53DRAFT_387281 [Violaceomyces palustris]
MTAIVFGATGAVGKHLLSSLMESNKFTSIHSFVRSLPNSTSETLSKLEHHLVDFEKLCSEDEAEVGKLRKIKADAVFITLGTTRGNAGSAEKFERIDRDYVLASAKAALNPDHPSKVIYCSAQMADSSSRFLYPKSKGLTEEGLAKLYKEAIIFRPGFLAQADRPQKRILEEIYGRITSLASHFTPSVEIQVSTLGRAMVKAGEVGSSGLKGYGIGSPPGAKFQKQAEGDVTIVSNAEAKVLAEKS